MIKDLLLDILFPKVCINCGKEGKYICDRCKVFISECEEAHNLECLDGLTSIWDYEGLIKELIHTAKYQGVTDIIKELIGMIDCHSEPAGEESRGNSTGSFTSFRMTMPSIVTYVPMLRKREKRRGFNQAEIIAKELAKKAGALCLPLLEKIADTQDQIKLSKEKRLENVKRSFVEARPLKNLIEATRGRASVLLVDDVFTTGATMNECCKVLKQAGIKKVWGFTLARTP